MEKDTTYMRKEAGQDLTHQCSQLLRSQDGLQILCLMERYFNCNETAMMLRLNNIVCFKMISNMH